jgi:hypothetical protein
MDGTEVKQDIETSADNQGTSEETETFTKEQVEKMVSDRLAQAGREAKSLETRQADLDKREAQIKETMAQIQKAEEERELRELEGLTEDPKVKQDLASYKKKLAEQKRALIQMEADLKTKEAQFNEKFEKATKTELELTISAVAKEQNVDLEVLKEKINKLGLKDKDSIVEIASVMQKKTPTPAPDSGKTLGGTNISGLSPEAKIRYGMEHPEAKMN